MKIECIIQRQGGTLAEIGGTEYHFQPDSDGRHVCDVQNKEHAARFISITEGYRACEPVKPAIPASKNAVIDHLDTLIDTAETIHPAEVAAVAEVAAEPATDMSRDDLVRVFVERFGHKPHGKWDAARIKKELGQ